jgi:Zn-dependent membrane protease YugP
VEVTDLGDHYDPRDKAVRLSRDKLEGKTLTAVTTAAHEVAHALQDASAYGPFVWRARLAKVAQVTGEVGFTLLLAAPVASLASRQPIPPALLGSTVFAMLGTGMAAQLAALPTELDASFARALPMLRDEYISATQVKDARKILIACSLTYITSSLVAVLNIWPWLGRRPAMARAQGSGNLAHLTAAPVVTRGTAAKRHRRVGTRARSVRKSNNTGFTEAALRQFGKPLIRSWIRLSRGL